MSKLEVQRFGKSETNENRNLSMGNEKQCKIDLEYLHGPSGAVKSLQKPFQNAAADNLA